MLPYIGIPRGKSISPLQMSLVRDSSVSPAGVEYGSKGTDRITFCVLCIISHFRKQISYDRYDTQIPLIRETVNCYKEI